MVNFDPCCEGRRGEGEGEGVRRGKGKEEEEETKEEEKKERMKGKGGKGTVLPEGHQQGEWLQWGSSQRACSAESGCLLLD